MRENEFLGYVLDVAARYGWRAWHVPMPVRPIPGGKTVAEPRAKGLFDLVLMHRDPPRLILAELKAKNETLTPEQREFWDLALEIVDARTPVRSEPPPRPPTPPRPRTAPWRA